jgi:DUF1009 family protein
VAGRARKDVAAGVKTVGLIAGSGELPAVLASAAREKGYRVALVALKSLADESLEGFADVAGWFNAGKVGSIIKFLKKTGAGGVVLAGKVPKSLLYAGGGGGGGFRPDLRALGILMRLKDRRDDSILMAVDREFRKEGMEVLDMRELVPDIFTPEGRLTNRGPGRKQWKDIRFGLEMAKEAGRLDIGQTVVVKEGAVMAVEAIEGTDEAIRRGGVLAGEGSVVVKASRPGQDPRFDVPLVGTATIDVMAEVGAGVLALEAEKSILLKREEFIGKADLAGIRVVGVKGTL